MLDLSRVLELLPDELGLLPGEWERHQITDDF